LYKSLEVLGPEHEYAVIDEDLHPLPIVDKVIKHLTGRIRNNAVFEKFTFEKELQCHVAELKPNRPFRSPIDFEETMYEAVLEISETLRQTFHAKLLGSGMHPTLRVEDAEIWPHRDRKIYEALSHIFNIRQHGWLNIQAFQLNFSYRKEEDAVKLYNTLTTVLPYLPALSASSPIYESKPRKIPNNRLHFYQINQEEIPSIVGDVIPEHIDSFNDYRELTIKRYSRDLLEAGASPYIVNKEWINSRGAIIRFDRRAIEVRIMDEQECIKADVALSCFLRALLRGLLEDPELNPPHTSLIQDFKTIVKDGMNAETHHPRGSTAQDVCRHLYRVAEKNADEEEKRYLWIVKKRIEEGPLSYLITRDVERRHRETSLEEAILKVYSNLSENLQKNQIYT
jgi:gamma-glutamyl:cysteine ligase YbdK (ATP-grasp superfamily)